jgi:hypothetical protein
MSTFRKFSRKVHYIRVILQLPHVRGPIISATRPSISREGILLEMSPLAKEIICHSDLDVVATAACCKRHPVVVLVLNKAWVGEVDI